MTSMTMAPIVLKLTFGDDIRRTSAPEMSFQAIHKACAEVFISELDGRGFELKYRDDDGDLCTLTLATFSDFQFLNQGTKTIRLDMLPTPRPAVSADQGAAAAAAGVGSTTAGQTPGLPGSTPCVPLGQALAPLLQNLPALLMGMPQMQFQNTQADAEAPSSGGANQQQWQQHGQSTNQGMPPPCAAFFQNFCGGDALAGLFVHFAPILLQQLSSHQEDIDKHVAEKKEVLLPAVQAFREGLDPFPSFQETQIALDKILAGDSMQGLGAALVLFLQTFCQLPQDEQHDVSSIVINNVADKMQHIIPALFYNAPCGPADAEPFCKGRGKGWCWKGKGNCKGEGKGKGKGKGKHHRWWKALLSSSSSDSSTSSDGSASDSDHDKEYAAGLEAWEVAKQQRWVAKANLKEAKQRMKKEVKTAKKAWKEQMKAMRQQKKAWKQAKRQQRHAAWTSHASPATVETCTAGVEAAAHADNAAHAAHAAQEAAAAHAAHAAQAAQEAAAAHAAHAAHAAQEAAAAHAAHTAHAAHETHAAHAAHAAHEAHAAHAAHAAHEAHAAHAALAAQAAHTAHAAHAAPLQVLAEMGFTNEALNAELLAFHKNDLKAVIDVLAGGW